MPPFSDEHLMAYADGELPPAQAAAIADAARSDDVLARRIERFATTRRVLGSRFSNHLEEPIPQRLLDLLQAPATIKPIAQRPPRARHRWLTLALAASLVLGVGLLSSRLLAPSPDALSATLETALTGQLRQTAAGEIVALSTLRTDAGQYCREYEISRAGHNQRGVACRDEGGRWTETPLPSTASPPADYQTAAGDADAAHALQARRLTPDEEQQLIVTQWK